MNFFCYKRFSLTDRDKANFCLDRDETCVSKMVISFWTFFFLLILSVIGNIELPLLDFFTIFELLESQLIGLPPDRSDRQ